MLVLLPPSEGKTRPGPRRAALLAGRAELARADRRPRAGARRARRASARPDALGGARASGASLADEVAANRTLRAAPAAPAGQVYSGVLYDALGLADLSAAARRRANRWLVVDVRTVGRAAPDRPDPRVPAVDGHHPAGRRPAGRVLASAAGRAADRAPPDAASWWTCARRPTRPPGRRPGSWPRAPSRSACCARSTVLRCVRTARDQPRPRR